MDHTTHPLRFVLRGGVLLAVVNTVVAMMRAPNDSSGAQLHTAFALLLITAMIATIGEYVGALQRRLRDRPAYAYVREA